jgi:hypothetical protein
MDIPPFWAFVPLNVLNHGPALNDIEQLQATVLLPKRRKSEW